MTRTLTAATIIDLPCERSGGDVLCWDCSVCAGNGYNTFAVCVVDGEEAWRPEVDQYHVTVGPPAWLTRCEVCGASEEDYDLAFQFRDWDTVSRIGDCPDCINGRPAVTVQEVRGDGAEWLLGHGTVERILPVVAWPDFDGQDDEPFVTIPPTTGTVRMWLGHGNVHTLDIDPTSKYVVLVRLTE